MKNMWEPGCAFYSFFILLLTCTSSILQRTNRGAKPNHKRSSGKKTRSKCSSVITLNVFSQTLFYLCDTWIEWKCFNHLQNMKRRRRRDILRVQLVRIFELLADAGVISHVYVTQAVETSFRKPLYELRDAFFLGGGFPDPVEVWMERATLWTARCSSTWTSPGSCWRRKTTRTLTRWRTSALTSAHWWPISFRMFQVRLSYALDCLVKFKQ